MSNTVWTTLTMREDNLRMFGLSFPNKFDYPTYKKIESICSGQEKVDTNLSLFSVAFGLIPKLY